MRKVLAIALCIVWMGVIFYNSSNNGTVSNDKSYTVEGYLKKQYNLFKKSVQLLSKDETVKDNTTKQNTEVKNKVSSNNKVDKKEKINIIIRKNAHAFEYLTLALLVGNLLFSFNFKGKNAVVYILFICLFYAVTDEFHQIFVVGRTSSVADVLIDFLGSIVGTSLFYLMYYRYFKDKSII